MSDKHENGEDNGKEAAGELTSRQRSIERAAALYYEGCRWAARLVRRLKRTKSDAQG